MAQGASPGYEPRSLYELLKRGAPPEVPVPNVPVILRPNSKRDAQKQQPPATAHHLGFLFIDPAGGKRGPGKFYPLLPVRGPAKPASTNKLDIYSCTSHWGNGGCIRLLTNSQDTSLALMEESAFVALWEQRSLPAGDGASSSTATHQDGTSCASSGSSKAVWCVSRAQLLMLQEAYGGLHRKLKALGYNLDSCHYMLKGWETAGGGPRKKTSRSSYKGIESPDAAQHGLRAVANWPGLLDMIEQEQPHVTEMSTGQVLAYWLARMPNDFQRQLKEAGIINPRSTVHHIIAQASRGIDHPLNYYIIDGAANSSMGDKVDGIRGSDKKSRYHMRQVVGEKWYQVAVAACNLYHGMLHPTVKLTMRDVRRAAFEQAQQVMSQAAATPATAGATTTGATKRRREEAEDEGTPAPATSLSTDATEELAPASSDTTSTMPLPPASS